MTADEIRALAEGNLGWKRRFAARELRTLGERLQPDERVATLAFADRSLLLGGGGLLAATDRRLLIVSGSGCEVLDYGALTSVTDDAAHGEIGLVSARGVHTLKLSPAPRAAEVVAAIRAHVGADRIHERAGGDEARRSQRALALTALCVCLVIGGCGARGAIQNAWEDRHSSPPGLDELTAGQCLDVEAHIVACDADGAFFVVRGPRDMRGCSSASPTIVDGFVTTTAAKRKLSRWCIGVAAPRR